MSFQKRVFQWVTHAFGKVKAESHKERCRRFFEEATELVQALGMTKEECVHLVDYVYGREVGEVGQELGGVSVTLHALAEAAGEDLAVRGEEELARIWTCVDKIRKRNEKKMGSVRHEVATEIAALAVTQSWDIYLDQNLESDLGFTSYHRSELMSQFLHNHGVDVFAAEAHGWRTVADVEQTFNKHLAVKEEKSDAEKIFDYTESAHGPVTINVKAINPPGEYSGFSVGTSSMWETWSIKSSDTSAPGFKHVKTLPLLDLDKPEDLRLFIANQVRAVIAEVCCVSKASDEQELRSDLYMDDVALSEIVNRLSENCPDITRQVADKWVTVGDVIAAVNKGEGA